MNNAGTLKETIDAFVEHIEQYVNDSTCLFTRHLSLQTIDQYVLLVRASDLNGAPGGNEATGTVIIQINDVNDNVPVLQGPVRKDLHYVYFYTVLICCCSGPCNFCKFFFLFPQFEATVDENTEKIEVMRLKAKDLDLENTDNWVTNCFIASGNEAGYFSIHTDPKTNDAVIMLDKVCNDICWLFCFQNFQHSCEQVFL